MRLPLRITIPVYKPFSPTTDDDAGTSASTLTSASSASPASQQSILQEENPHILICPV
jgi:hypothetical protein